MMKLDGEGGFPHSEICGSKVAHTSPQLIAACHVLHRLCMPRHPPIALTSRLRIHTTNDRFGTRLSSACRALSQGLAGPGCNPSQPPRKATTSTQLDNLVVSARTSPSGRRTARFEEKPMPSRHRFLEPIHNVKEGFRPASAPPERREYLVFIPGKEVQRPARRQSQQSCALWRTLQRWPCSPSVRSS